MSRGCRLIYLGEERMLTDRTVTGLEIRQLFDLSSDGDLVVEGHDDEPDRIVADYEVIRLSDSATSIFLRPMTAFGS